VTTTWPEVTLGDLCTFNYGKSLPGGKRAGEGAPVFGSNGVVGFHSSTLTSGPTIVIGRKGSYGEVHYSADSCWPIDTTYYIDQASTSADLRWLYYRLRALGLTDLNRAAAIPGLNREDAYRRRLLLPPVEEQRRIAAILDAADEVRAKRRESLGLLDSLTESIFLNMFGDRRANVRGWPEMALGEIAQLFAGGSLPSGELWAGRDDGYLLAKVSDLNLVGNERELVRAARWSNSPVPDRQPALRVRL
jgi:type I restriction enzyme S subunit